jgi:hypothetical protein
MGKAHPRSLVLDAGALIAFERGDGRMRDLPCMRVEANERPRVRDRGAEAMT